MKFETEDARKARRVYNRRALEELLERFMAMPLGEPGSITLHFDEEGRFRKREWRIVDGVKKGAG